MTADSGKLSSDQSRNPFGFTDTAAPEQVRVQSHFYLDTGYIDIVPPSPHSGRRATRWLAGTGTAGTTVVLARMRELERNNNVRLLSSADDFGPSSILLAAAALPFARKLARGGASSPLSILTW